MARPASRFRAIRVTPRQGGQLLTSGISAEEAGFQNYVVKRDWRRDQTDEMRREGFDLFHPNLTIPVGFQPFPQVQVLTGHTKEKNIVTDPEGNIHVTDPETDDSVIIDPE